MDAPPCWTVSQGDAGSRRYSALTQILRWCAVVVALAFAAAPTIAASEPGSARPNLVFILIDDMGYADIGPFGARDVRTPALNRMAREGLKFTASYANGPVCTPTRAGFVTGRYQQRYGLEWAITPPQKEFGLPGSAPSIARALKERGYVTALIGKWHLGARPVFSPVVHGFDESFYISGGNADMYSHKNAEGENVLFENGEPTSHDGYLTDLLNERALAFVKKHRAQPFFLYLAYNGAHWPFQRPDRPADVRNKDSWYDGSREDYAAMIERVDAGVGRLIEQLDELGLGNNTLVVFTNDNGGERLSRNEPLRDRKGSLWEGGIRVPTLARWPGRLPAGATSAHPIITMDWTATFLALAGARSPAPLDGENILGLLTHPATPIRERTLFWRKDHDGVVQKAARQGRWKYVRDGTTEHLFDLIADPGETDDVAHQHLDMVKKLRADVMRWETEVDRDPPLRRIL